MATWRAPKDQEKCVEHYEVKVNDADVVNNFMKTEYKVANVSETKDGDKYDVSVKAVAKDNKLTKEKTETYTGKLFLNLKKYFMGYVWRSINIIYKFNFSKQQCGEYFKYDGSYCLTLCNYGVILKKQVLRHIYFIILNSNISQLHLRDIIVIIL